jgi:hypothetical protein
MAWIEPNGLALAFFAATFAICCLSFFTLAGMFPHSSRPQSVAGLAGTALVLFNLVLLVALLTSVMLFAQHSLRWTSSVVFGGLIFLFAPSIFQIISRKWRDSRGGLALLGLVQIASLALIITRLDGLPFP